MEALKAMGVTGVIAQACDVGDRTRVAALMDTIEREAGTLDILVNNAADQGLGLGGPLEMEPDAILKVMGTNVRGGFQVTQAAANRFFMKKPYEVGGPYRGTVVFLSSNTAMRAIRNRTAYCASKGAIIPDSMRALADLRSRVRVPIACGERLYSTQQVMDAIELRACDYLQPDSSHAGGLTEMKKIAGLCDAHHIPFCAHNPSGPVANAVTLALGVSTPGYCIHETLFDDVPWRKDVIDEDVKFVDGMMYAPSAWSDAAYFAIISNSRHA